MNANEPDELLAEKLGTIRLQEPSDDFLQQGLTTIRSQQPSSAWSLFDSSVGWAITAALVLSLSVNLMQSLDNNLASIVPANTAERSQSLLANSNPQLQITDVAVNDSVFRFLCFTKTTLVMDSNIGLGELRGFGEWILFEVPNNYKVNVSLLPLRDWSAIGEFRDGRISLALEDGHQLSLLGAGIGPTSLKQGGPFPVYGSIEKLNPVNSVDNLLIAAAEEKQRRLLASDQNLDVTQQSAAQANPYLPVRNIQAGIDTALDERTRKYFGAFIADDECG